MLIKMFKSKIHRAKITEANLSYEGSIMISGELLDSSNIRENECVHVWNLNNGERLTTYALRGPEGSGCISLNGAAARLAQVGDLVIITTFADMTNSEAQEFKPTVVLVDENNKIKLVSDFSGREDE